MSAPRRRYDSPLRAQRAAETRRRIIEAAAEVFDERGYAGGTLAEIAKRAGVAIDTVRSTGSKAYLLLEAFRVRYTGEGGWASVLELGSVQSIFDIEGRDDGLQAVADFLVAAHPHSARLWLVVRAAALTHGEVAEGFAELSRLREESFLYTTRWLVRIGLVADPGDDEQALRALTAVVAFTMSAETYLLLTGDYGLDDDAYRSWIVRTVPGLRSAP